MNTQDAKRVFTGLQLSNTQKSIIKMSIKLDKVKAKVAFNADNDIKVSTQLVADQEMLQLTINKFKAKEEKLLAILQVDAPTLGKVEAPTPLVDEIKGLWVGDGIELKGIKYSIVEEGYKVAKIGKDGKATKQIKYVSKKDVV